ncbi:divergent polysaccharide deacetylase family protein [Enhydrobacter aerosaccus]|uniref:divergent polysaccharide deacetylase family protein n=1 Tax=Enhydrobacter aerosaccus TaxID=225324 RepID=UPI001E54ABA6|nr:divergent polysaccharide deacetylase family protein [Enhydrobacter aerosaccus]
MTWRYRGLLQWVADHRWHSVAAGLLLLFAGSIPLGYWLGTKLDSVDRDRVVRETLSEMKQEGGSQPPAKYARIEDIPGLPQYTEAEPGQIRATVEDKPRGAPKPAPQLAALAPGELPPWRRYAVPFRDLNSRPLITIVIDDVGLDRPRSKRAWELPGPITLSFLPYAKDLREQAKTARAHGNELMLHMPMEPTGHADPGPNALLVSLNDGDIRQRVVADLDSFDGYVGVNNHMGSRFTAYRPGMEIVLRIFKTRGLLFLDSRTTAQTVGESLAQELGVPSINRNVFLDDDESLGAVKRKLAETEEVARRQGFAVAIGHPHENTLQALAEWLPGVSAKGFALAPLTAALRKRNGWD